MHAQSVADRLRSRIPAPPGAVTVWPWHEDSGTVVLHVVLNPTFWVDIGAIPKIFEGFQVVIERLNAPVAQTNSK